MPCRASLALVVLALLAAVLGSASPRSLHIARAERAERIETHDNERAAGTLRNGVLVMHLEARVGTWHPHGPKLTGADVPALGEAGRRLQIPSPMIRVPAGTEVALTVRNTLFSTLTLHGLVPRPVPAEGAAPVEIPPGATRELRFRLDAPGTYHYWGTTMGRTFLARTKEDAQINGAIIVDGPGDRRPRDRVFVMGQWADTTPSELNRDVSMRRLLLVINGRSWPHTERLSYTAGDTVRWRLVNTSANVHPMHLHGFHFRVDSRGDGLADTLYDERRRDLVVTERMIASATTAITWVPDRPGNWLFHCHFTSHFSPRGELGLRIDERMRPESHGGHQPDDAMSGLVLGVEVAPRRTGRKTIVDEIPRRRVRLVVRARESAGDIPIYDVAVHDGGPEPSPSVEPRAGQPLVLERDVPAEITVVNRTSSPTSIHWHGIELESFFDGVAGFSGSRGRLSPLIAPGDSFRVRMQPPRAGTFIYHTHVDELRQQPGGLAGALIVVEPGQRRDPATDIPLLISTPRDPGDAERAVFINGRLAPDTLVMRAGVAHRLRLINITTGRPGTVVTVQRDTVPVRWRALAKDGADLPEERQLAKPARQLISIGETYDFELTPDAEGRLLIEVRTGLGVLLARQPIAVRGR